MLRPILGKLRIEPAAELTPRDAEGPQQLVDLARGHVAATVLDEPDERAVHLGLKREAILPTAAAYAA